MKRIYRSFGSYGAVSMTDPASIALDALGYASPVRRDNIAAFQEDVGLRPTGRIDRDTAWTLRELYTETTKVDIDIPEDKKSSGTTFLVIGGIVVGLLAVGSILIAAGPKRKK